MLAMTTIESPLGTLRLVADGDALIGMHFPNDEHVPGGAVARDTEVLARTATQLAEYFAGTRRAFDLPVAPRGTSFQQRVWRALASIPFAATWSYGDLARAIGQPSASRAVGAANGRNPIAIIIPCHRVIGSNGALTGYGGGMPAKEWLLTHERARAGVRAAQATLW